MWSVQLANVTATWRGISGYKNAHVCAISRVTMGIGAHIVEHPHAVEEQKQCQELTKSCLTVIYDAFSKCFIASRRAKDAIVTIAASAATAAIVSRCTPPRASVNPRRSIWLWPSTRAGARSGTPSAVVLEGRFLATGDLGHIAGAKDTGSTELSRTRHCSNMPVHNEITTLLTASLDGGCAPFAHTDRPCLFLTRCTPGNSHHTSPIYIVHIAAALSRSTDSHRHATYITSHHRHN